MNRQSLKSFFSDNLSLIFFVAANTTVLTLIFIISGPSLMLRAKQAYTAFDALQYYIYTIALISWIGLAHLLFQLALKKLVRSLIFCAGISIVWHFLLFFITIADIKMYRILSVHVYSPFIMDSLYNISKVQNETHFSAGTLISIIVVLSALIAGEIALFWLLHRKITAWVEQREAAIRRIGCAVSGLLIICSAAAIFIMAASNIKDNTVFGAFPFYEIDDYFYQFVRARSMPVQYPLEKDNYPALSKKKNVLYILVESWRGDMFTPEFSPSMTSFAQTHPCIASKHHFTSAHSTTYSVFSYLSGLHAYHLDFFADAQKKLYPFELLKKNGYTLYGATSSQLFNFSKQINSVVNQFDVYREFLRTIDYEKDYDMLKWVKETYAAHDKNKPFFMFIFLNATHHNYYFPPEFEKYKPVMPADYNHFMGDDKLVLYKDQIFNRYKNASLFTDHLVAMLFDIFKPEIDADNLIVSVTGDHGEEFWDRGGLGHGQSKFINPRISVPLLLCLPAQGNHEIELSSEADIMPTVIDALSPGDSFNFTSFFNGSSLLRPLPEDRYVIVSGHGFPDRNDCLALITKDGIMGLSKDTRTIDMKNNFAPYEITDYEKNQPVQQAASHQKGLQQFNKEFIRFFNTQKP